ARAGLLHDLYFYHTKTYVKNKHAIKHSKYHPQNALANAEKIIKLNDRERDMIYKHMWPVTPEKPKYAETYLITFVDKYCAMIEFILPQPKNFMNFLKNHRLKIYKKILDK
ncbi:MAG: HD family phosphohydrolase, partial [Oscillospiraceae bacterium]|nr:HD family phosphohydrolase [Oscillospiraceae bacterium]